jgi:hypothetical protein
MYFANITSVNIDVDGSGNRDVLKNLTARAKVSDALINNAAFYETVAVEDGERPDIMSKRLYDTEQYHWTFLLLNPQIKNIWDDWPMKQAQLIEYCTQKYQYLAADTNDDLNNKFILDETVIGSISNATGKVKEIHVNMGYLVIEKTTGTFAVSGETISGIDSQDNISCNFIKSQAYAPHHHIDDSTGEWVMRRLAGTTPFTYIDYESAVTEQNRNIKVIKQAHIRIIAAEFIAAMGI